MATITKSMARSSFQTTVSDLYVVPSSTTTAIVTNIVITNTIASGQTFTILLDDVELFSNTPIAGNSTISVDIKQVLDPSASPRKITGLASSGSVRYHISGIELT